MIGLQRNGFVEKFDGLGVLFSSHKEITECHKRGGVSLKRLLGSTKVKRGGGVVLGFQQAASSRQQGWKMSICLIKKVGIGLDRTLQLAFGMSLAGKCHEGLEGFFKRLGGRCCHDAFGVSRGRGGTNLYGEPTLRFKTRGGTSESNGFRRVD